MIPLPSKPKVPVASSMSQARRRKRFSAGMFIGVAVTLAIVLLAGAAFALQRFGSSYAAPVEKSSFHAGHITTINGLNTITQIGSTTNILDPNGNAITANPDPY